MTKAADVADILSFEFMKRGSYAAAGPINPTELFPNRIISAVAQDDQVEAFVDEGEGFSNLEVQSVGYEEGVDEPKVHLYLKGGSTKLIKSLPNP